jgi:hypothetical protein
MNALDGDAEVKAKDGKKFFDDEAGCLVAKFAGLATRKAARAARAAGYSAVCQHGKCVVKSPGRATVIISLKNVRIDASKRYTFAQ